ncbi:hypothetical protein D8682_01120 (plasmid) [Buttiauxella sp. 3AFRM03]|uniref:hypothetical protein n=1 Tax=Buttiauxella sp. 3AFRM03 TaxID=2479367 RepID=UPI000EF79E9F|nr:hypothetical protein [Buttiauxella sp. 3AFRM03]AYN25710.1 hypothetical protein D8682_01120 [Buttiauxella sp. 3AFRM03]
MKKLLLLMVIPFFSSGGITPEIANPDKFNENLFNQITSSNYLATISGCKVISLKMFHPPERKNIHYRILGFVCSLLMSLLTGTDRGKHYLKRFILIKNRALEKQKVHFKQGRHSAFSGLLWH